MKLIAPSVLALVATTAAISTQLVKNYCNEEVFLTLAVNATEDATGPFPVPSGQAFTSEIIGQGNTAIITKNNDTFNSATPKMIMGSSTDLGVLYW